MTITSCGNYFASIHKCSTDNHVKQVALVNHHASVLNLSVFLLNVLSSIHSHNTYNSS